MGTSPFQPWGSCFPGEPRGCVSILASGCLLGRGPNPGQAGGGKRRKQLLKTGKDGTPGAHPGKLPVAIPGAGRALGTAAALAEGVMDMTVRPLPRSQHSNPQAGVGAGEGSQGAAVPARLLRLLGKGTW